MGPGWVADRFEVLEVSGEGIKSLDEIISSSETNVTYSPYVEFNDGNDQIYFSGGVYYPGVHIYDKGESGPAEVGSITYNVDGYKDLITTGGAYPETQTRIYIEMNNCSAADFIQNSMDQVSIFIDCSLPYDIDHVAWRRFSSSYTHSGRSLIEEPSSWLDDRTGASYFNMTLSETVLNAGASHQGTGLYHTLQFGLRFPGGITGDVPVYVDFQINPGYFEEETTVWNNQTITTYEPYILTVGSSYHWHKWSLGGGGVLICAIALVSTPLINFRRKSRK